MLKAYFLRRFDWRVDELLKDRQLEKSRHEVFRVYLGW